MADTTLPALLDTGDHASRPAASAVGTGALYSCTDHDLIYQTDGSSWTTWADLSGSGTVIGATSTYTPAWTSDGSAPSIGNGTLSGRYVIIGSQLLWIAIRFVRGSTSSNGTGNYSFSMPSAYKALNTNGVPQTLPARLLDSGTAHFSATALINGNATTFQVFVADASGVRQFGASVPITLATSDELNITGIIEVEAV